MAEAVFSDVDTDQVLFTFEVVPNEQGSNGVEVRHGAGVSTMVGPRLPRRINYAAKLYTEDGSRPKQLLRQVEEALLGKKVHIDSDIQPYRDIEWAVEFVNPSIADSEGNNVINVQISAIEEFDQDAALEIVAIKIPVAPENTDEATAEGETPEAGTLSDVPIGADSSCQPATGAGFIIGGTAGTIIGAAGRAGTIAAGATVEVASEVGKGIGRVSRKIGKTVFGRFSKGAKKAGNDIFGQKEGDNGFSEGFEQGIRIGFEGRGACRT